MSKRRDGRSDYWIDGQIERCSVEVMDRDRWIKDKS